MAKFIDTIKGTVGKIKELWTDDSDILADDEILEEYADEVVIAKKSEIVSGRDSKSVAHQEKIPERQPKIETQAPAARKTAQPATLYAHENKYTGAVAYDDNSTVAFSVAGNTSFKPKTEHTETLTVAAKTNETFGDRNISAEITPVKPAATYSQTAAPAARTNTEPVKGFSFSSVNEPATFGSRPSVSLDSTAPATSRASAIVNEEPEIVRAKAPVGFNTSGAGSTGTQNYNPARTNSGGRGMEKMTVQILKPTDISEASEASNLLKNGIIVIAELSGIADKNARVRYSDFLCGCCKGCDADFREIVPVDAANSVLIAVPTGLTLKMPVEKVRETPAATSQATPGAKVNEQVDSLFSNLDISNSQGFRGYGRY